LIVDVIELENLYLVVIITSEYKFLDKKDLKISQIKTNTLTLEMPWDMLCLVVENLKD